VDKEKAVNSHDKASVADLNMDGKPDVIVMAWKRRPKILRNTSVGSVISFVDWTPGNTFNKNDPANYGFHAVAFDSGDGDGFLDIFLASKFEADLFFDNVASFEMEEPFAHGDFTATILDQDPISVKGTFSADPETDICLTDPTESFVRDPMVEVITVSVVLNSPSCTTTDLIVDKLVGLDWIPLGEFPSQGGDEIAAQFDNGVINNADQLRFTMTGTGCDPAEPYFLEVLARTDKP